jgi:hypothetical protein
MSSIKWVVAVALLAATVAAAAALASTAPTPILTGPRPMDGAGFGQVKPATIYLGGDPTGLV